MAFRLGQSTQQAACDAVVDAIDLGSTNSTGRILIYTGTQPTDPQTTATGTLLATINFNNPSFGSANTSGVATMVTSPAVTASVVATGTPGYFRFTNRNNVAILDGNITITAGGGDITFDSVTWISGGVATISSFTVTVPM